MHPRQIMRLVAAIMAVYFIYMGTLGAQSLPHPQSEPVSAAQPQIDTDAEPEPAVQDGRTYYPVIHVVDGDTMEVRKDGGIVKVRLIGINTPEVVDPRRPVQCFGKEASAEAHRMLDGQSVSLETDPSQDTYDKYGRLLAYARLPDGTLFNEHMIAAGFAHEYTYELPYRYQAGFKAAEKAAREARRGLWATDTCAGDTTQAAH